MESNLVAFKGLRPVVADDAFVDPTARIIGNVVIAAGASIWSHAVIRGDDDRVEIGERAAVLENCLVEAPEGRPVVIGAGALISHGAIVHGATVEDGALVGIGAIVLDSASIGRGAIVAAGSVVPPKSQVAPGQLVVGTPARPVREVGEAEAANVRAEIERVAGKAQVYREMFPPG
jgi:carbonic anhydrase/acetyltransferase-like protein (isoleucine patch superfamily)